MMFNSLLRSIRIQKAIAKVFEENHDLLEAIAKDEESTPDNLTWLEEDLSLWKGWTYSSNKNRYYFDDIGSESLSEFWSTDFLNQAYERI